MTHILHLIFIFPLEAAMKVALDSAYAVTDSYGVSLVILSVLVNAVLLPLYFLAEKWKVDVKGKHAQMASELSSIKKHSKGQERYFYIRAVYRRFNYHPLSPIKVSFGFLIQIPFFFAAYHLLLNFPAFEGVGFLFIKDLGAPDRLATFGDTAINVLPIVMTAVNILSAYVYAARMDHKEKMQLWVLALIFLVVLYSASAGLVFYWTLNNLFSMMKNGIGHFFNLQYLQSPAMEVKDRPNENFVSDIKVWCQRTADHIFDVGSKSGSRPGFLPFAYFYCAIIYVVAVLNPLYIYYSSPDSFGINSESLFITHIVTMVGKCLVGGVGMYLITVFVGPLSSILTRLSLAVAVVVYIFGYAVDYNLGIIRGVSFTNIEVLAGMSLSSKIIEALLLISLFAGVLRYYHQIVKPVALFLAVVLVLQSVDAIKFVHNYKALFDRGSLTAEQKPVPTLPENTGEVFSFSRDHPNIVVFILDAFPAQLLSELLMVRSDLIEGLDGFTWFRNTVSTGGFTLPSTAALVGGHRYTVRQKNNDNEKTVGEFIDEAWSLYPHVFGGMGYSISFIDPQWITKDFERLLVDRGVNVHHYGQYIPYWRKKKVLSMEASISASFYDETLWQLSLFKSMPGFVKACHYRRINATLNRSSAKTQWSMQNTPLLNLLSSEDDPAFNSSYIEKVQKNGTANWMLNSYLKFWPILDLLDEVSNAISDKPTLKFFWSRATIRGGSQSAGCGPAVDDYLRGEYDKDGDEEYTYHMACALQALSDWFDWMKVNNVYDNTKIIIASDHGSSGRGRKWDHEAIFALLMVKDFNERGSLHVSKQLMSNADIAAILCSTIGGCEGIGEDPIRKPAENRVVEHAITQHGNWDWRQKKKFRVKRYVQVRDDVYDEDNWEYTEK